MGWGIAVKESAVLLGTAGSSVGITTDPQATQSANGYAVILLNAGLLHRVGPNRMNVRLARQLAESGFVVLRLDFSGVGDSLVRQDSLTREAAVLAEAHDAIELLRATRGVTKFILVGLCWGAACAFEIAVQEPSVAGAFMIDGFAYRTPRFHMTRFFKRLMNVRKWCNLVMGRRDSGRRLRRMFGLSSSPESGVPSQPVEHRRSFPPLEQVRKDVESLVNRGAHLCFVYTEGGMKNFYNYPDQLWDFLPIARRSKNIRVKFARQTDHTFTMIRHQNQLIRTIKHWATGIAGRITPVENGPKTET